MKFQVSVLSDKGVKKTVAVVEADSYDEARGGRDSENLFSSSYVRVKFYEWLDLGWWSRGTNKLVASVVIAGSYVIEQVGL